MSEKHVINTQICGQINFFQISFDNQMAHSFCFPNTIPDNVTVSNKMYILVELF